MAGEKPTAPQSSTPRESSEQEEAVDPTLPPNYKSLSGQLPRTSVHALARQGIRREGNNLPRSRTRSRSSLSLEHAPRLRNRGGKGVAPRSLQVVSTWGYHAPSHLRGTWLLSCGGKREEIGGKVSRGHSKLQKQVLALSPLAPSLHPGSPPPSTTALPSFLSATGGCVSSFLSTTPTLGGSGFLRSFWDSLRSCLPAALELVWAAAWAALLAPGPPTPPPPASFFLFSAAFNTSKGSDSSSNNWSNRLVTTQPKPSCKCPGMMVARRRVPPRIAAGRAEPRAPASALPTRWPGRERGAVFSSGARHTSGSSQLCTALWGM